MTWISVFGASSSSLDASVGVDGGRGNVVGGSDFSNYREWEDVSAAGKQPMNSGSGGSIHIAIAIAACRDRAGARAGAGAGAGAWHMEWETQRSAARRGLAQRARLQAQHAAALALALELKSVAPRTCRESKTICKKAVDS